MTFRFSNSGGLSLQHMGLHTHPSHARGPNDYTALSRTPSRVEAGMNKARNTTATPPALRVTDLGLRCPPLSALPSAGTAASFACPHFHHGPLQMPPSSPRHPDSFLQTSREAILEMWRGPPEALCSETPCLLMHSLPTPEALQTHRPGTPCTCTHMHTYTQQAAATAAVASFRKTEFSPCVVETILGDLLDRGEDWGPDIMSQGRCSRGGQQR